MDSRSDSAALRLTSLLAPVPADQFVTEYWLERHLFCRGDRDRFANLLSWTVLNRILEQHWRETYRFRLALQGRDLAPESYADLEGYTPRIRAKDVIDHLRRGATLSFDAIDELHEPLTRLAESFEAFFQGGTKINIYAGWRSLHGLDLHRDNQEIFILQLDGRKRWLLYGSSIDGIDTEALHSRSAPPPGAAFDEILQAGDLLYIPRGCYHVAVPMEEPTLHLTIGVKNARGIDLLTWMVDRLRGTPLAGRDLPNLAAAEERIRYSAQLRSALAEGLADDLVDQYFSESGSNLKPRPSFSLPWAATPEGLPRGTDFLVTLNPPSPVVVRDDPGATALEWRCGSRTCRFPRRMRMILDQLEVGTPQPFNRVLAALAGQLDEGTVRLLVAMLVSQNLVAVRAQ